MAKCVGSWGSGQGPTRLVCLFVSFSRNQKVTTYDQITYKYKGINV